MIKGYRARVGGMYEDLLVVQSVGPVATKHLISLIKRPWQDPLRTLGLRPHAKTALTSPLSHTDRKGH